MKSKIEILKELTDIQCRDGNWNYDPYMHGMANGMILALSILEDTEPQYLKAPEIWEKDIKHEYIDDGEKVDDWETVE